MHERERHRIILSAVQERPILTVQDIVELTDASEATIRRDISALALQNRLKKVRGGAEALHPPQIGVLAARAVRADETANSAQKPALYDTPEATANSRINSRLPYIFLLSRIAHYLKLIQRENIGTTKDRRLLELELNRWVGGLVTEMTDPSDDLQASHPLREAKVVVEDIDDNPGFFRVKLFAIPHFQVEGLDVNLSLVSRMPKAKA